MDEMEIIITKNRGWRGLAEVELRDKRTGLITQKMIFSFSQEVWDDMLNGYMVMQDMSKYYIIDFDSTPKPSFPRRNQQRSVLIKHFTAKVNNIFSYNKSEFMIAPPNIHNVLIEHFLKNKNNHTKSDWNYIGVRVIPEI